MSKSLEERLKTHSSAFDGLLSLIPAKYYYDEATQDQWKEKKKSKEELKQNKKLKLDPTVSNIQNSSAKDILKQREETATPVVIPGSKFKMKQQQEEKVEEKESDEDEVLDFNPSELEQDSADEEEGEEVASLKSTKSDDDDLINGNGELIFDDEGNEIEKKHEEKIKQQKLKKQEKLKKSGKKELSPEDAKERDERLAKLREKLSSKITAMKEKRKAPGTKVAGAPSSRQQILELRKQKLEQLKKRKLDEMEKSDSDNSDEESDEDEEDEETPKSKDSVLFGNIVFNDGDRITSDLSALRKQKSKKGPSNNDIKGHLAKLQLQKLKILLMDSEKRSKYEEKSKWNRLISNIEGVKLKDDEKLLKKALKRKEKQKMKSEREWKDRKDTVQTTIAARLKRREENLQLRKENKGVKSKKQQKMKRKFTGIVNSKKTALKTGDKKKRAGFEGRMKSGKKK